MHKIKLTGIALFCAMLAASAVSYHILPQKDHSVMENRSLETKPEWHLPDLLNGDFQEHYETYLSDQIYCRDSWVRLSTTMKRLIGKKEINGVYIGKDGYLLEKYKESDFDDAQIEKNIRIMSSFLNDAADRYGPDRVTCLFIPDKSDAMPDKLPDFAIPNTKKGKLVAAELRKQLRQPDIVLDVTSLLRSHQDEYIYYRTDHHWTTLGAYYAYCAWAGRTGHVPAKPEDYDREIIYNDFYGTTYNKVQVKVPADCVEIFHSEQEKGVFINEDDGDVTADSFYFPKAAEEGFNRYNLFFSKNTAMIHITTKAETNRSLLIVKDSFTNCFVPFLAGDYDQIFMIDCRYSKENVRDFLAEHTEITDVLVMYQLHQFMQETNLHALDGTAKPMETFDADSFFDE